MANPFKRLFRSSYTKEKQEELRYEKSTVCIFKEKLKNGNLLIHFDDCSGSKKAYDQMYNGSEIIKQVDDSNIITGLTATIQNEVGLLQNVLDEYKYIALIESIYKKSIDCPEPLYVESKAYNIWNRYAVPFRWLNDKIYYINRAYSSKKPVIYVVDYEFIKCLNEKLNNTLSDLADKEKQLTIWQLIGTIGLIFILCLVSVAIFG